MLFIRNIWVKAFLLWSLITLISVSMRAPEQAAAGAFIGFHYIFLFGIFFQILDNCVDKKNTRMILNGLCCIALAQTIYIVFQHFKLDPFFKGMIGKAGYESMDVKDLVVGTWGHTNFAGAYLAASIPLFLRKRWFWFIPFMILAIYWGRSWGAIAACAAGVIFWALFMTKGKTKIAIIVLTILGALLYSHLSEKQPINYFKSDRIQYMRPAFELLKLKPIVGIGLNQFKPAYYAVLKNVLTPEGSRQYVQDSHAHFDIIENTVETGLVGLIIIICFATSVFVIFSKKVTDLQPPRTLRRLISP